MWRWGAGALLALALVAPASAQETSRARLLTIPDAQTLSDHFPPIPLARGISGRAVLSCDIDTDGSSACRAVEQTPEAMGFGAAAEALAAEWRFAPRIENGTPVASTSRIPVVFENEFAEPAIIERAVYVAPPHPSGGTEIELSDDTIVISNCRPSTVPAVCAPARYIAGTQVQTNGYPQDAQATGVTGRALVACAVRSNRSIDCVVEAEAPSAHGFGTAAVNVVSRLNAGGAQREPGSVFRVPVVFATRDQDGQIEYPSYLRYGDYDWISRYYPDRAVGRRREGEVLLACGIQPDRRLDCTVLTETPADYWFGAAALRLLGDTLVTEEALGAPGFAAGDRIQVPVIFRLDRARRIP